MKRIRLFAPAVLLLILMVILLPIEGRAEEAAAAIPSIPADDTPLDPAVVILIPTTPVPIDPPEPEEPEDPTPVGGLSFEEATEAVSDVWMDVVTESQSQWSYFYFVPEETGIYTFRSSTDTYDDPYGMIFNAEQVELCHHDDYDPDNEYYDFEVGYHMVAGERYYLVVKGCYGGVTCQVFLTRATSWVDIEEPFSVITMESEPTTTTTKGKEVQYYSFTPDKSGEYVFYSKGTSGIGNPMLWVYDMQLNLVGENNNCTYNSFHSWLTVELEKGKLYHIVAGHDQTSTGSYQMAVLREKDIASRGCAFKNQENTLFVDIHGPNEQVFAH